MRAVVFGLIGAVLVVGGAQAAGCRLDGLEMLAGSQEPAVYDKGGIHFPVRRADLVGKTFTVVRSASNFWRVKPGAPGDLRDDGTIYAVVRSGSEEFVIKQVYNGNAGPQEMGYSFSPSDAKARAIDWSRRSLKAEQTRFGGSFDIYDGALSGITLKAPNCS